MIYFSYFGNINNLPEDAELYSIARSGKNFVDGYIEEVMPPLDLLMRWKGREITAYEYTMEYFEKVLEPLDIPAFVKKYDGAILLCWERPFEFCHRVLLRNHLLFNNVECAEWGANDDLFR